MKYLIVRNTMGDISYLNPFTLSFQEYKYYYTHPSAARADFLRLFPQSNGNSWHPAFDCEKESDLYPMGQQYQVEAYTDAGTLIPNLQA